MQHHEHMSEVSADIVVLHVRKGCETCQQHVRDTLDNS
jgi:hypothetical protein